jgi:hypothetical protein|tara:strand:+ start:68 stop:445 length:378 start_codon:yes stop_codon:yes gene_type:complete
MLQVKEYIALLIEQAENDPTRLKKDQIKVSIRLVMTKDAHVPDTLTKIRALSGVTVVGQKEPVNRNEKGSTVLEIYVKFLPTASDTYGNLRSVSKLIKAIPGVKIVRVLTVGGRPVLYKNKPIVI